MGIASNNIIALVTGGALTDDNQPVIDGNVFPTLSCQPDSSLFTEKPASDPTIRSQSESGAVITRARFTTIAKVWDLRYRFMLASDKTTLTAFEKTVNYGSGEFWWLHPLDNQYYKVKFAESVNYQIEPDNGSAYQCSFKLVEAYPESVTGTIS